VLFQLFVLRSTAVAAGSSALGRRLLCSGGVSCS